MAGPPFCENFECARDCSCNHLVTLCALDRSRCGAAQIVRSLAQLSGHFVPIGSLSSWHDASFEIARASLSSIGSVRYCQIVLALARCVSHCSCNLLGALGLSDRSRCCTVLNLRWLTPLGTLGVSNRSRCVAVPILMAKEILCRDLDKEVSSRGLV